MDVFHGLIFLRKGGNDTGIIANVLGAFKAKYRPLLLSRGEYVPTGTLRDNDIVGAIADAIAKNVGKLQPQPFAVCHITDT